MMRLPDAMSGTALIAAMIITGCSSHNAGTYSFYETWAQTNCRENCFHGPQKDARRFGRAVSPSVAAIWDLQRREAESENFTTHEVYDVDAVEARLFPPATPDTSVLVMPLPGMPNVTVLKEQRLPARIFGGRAANGSRFILRVLQRFIRPFDLMHLVANKITVDLYTLPMPEVCSLQTMAESLVPYVPYCAPAAPGNFIIAADVIEHGGHPTFVMVRSVPRRSPGELHRSLSAAVLDKTNER